MYNWPDILNGLFILGGALVNCLNVRMIIRDKILRGVSIWPALWFSTWGLWNLFFYAHLSQWWSLVAEFGIVGANVTWLGLAAYYRYK